jgi:hypothetical protein
MAMHFIQSNGASLASTPPYDTIRGYRVRQKGEGKQMEELDSPGRRLFIAAVTALLLPGSRAATQNVSAGSVRASGGKAAEVSIIGEPGVIDQKLTLADL